MAEISAFNVLQQIGHHRNDQANAHGINCQGDNDEGKGQRFVHARDPELLRYVRLHAKITQECGKLRRSFNAGQMARAADDVKAAAGDKLQGFAHQIRWGRTVVITGRCP